MGSVTIAAAVVCLHRLVFTLSYYITQSSWFKITLQFNIKYCSTISVWQFTIRVVLRVAVM